ncbi:MAG: hypothetical protein GY847_04600 [Proteobacteria bacterium]|nr:hypothetical protein [Pseudomonadota bacterium]
MAMLCLDEKDLHILYKERDNLLYFLAHEYLHLKRCVDGIPMIDSANGFWRYRVDNPLEHVAFFPILKEFDLGIDPYNHEKSDGWLNGTLEQREDLFPHHLACSCWRMLLCTQDTEYQQAALAELAKHNPQAAEMGQTITDRLRDLNFDLPETKVDAISIIRAVTNKRDVVRLCTMDVFQGVSQNWFRKKTYKTIGEIS